MTSTKMGVSVISTIENTLKQALSAESLVESQAFIESVLHNLCTLRDSEKMIEQLSDFYDNAPVGFYSLNSIGIIISSNKIFLEWLGYEASEVIGIMHITELFDEESRIIFFNTYENIKKNKTAIKDSERVFIRKDKTRLPVLLNVSIIEDNCGNFVATRSVVTDISVEKELERELQNLYNSAPCGYYATDNNRNIIRINDTMLEWLGYNREEVINKMHPSLFVLNTESAYAKEQRHKFGQYGMLKEAEYLLKRKNGSTFPTVLNAVAVKDNADNVIEIRVVVFDITEHKALEDELKMTTEALYQADEDKNKFIGLASHDLQNPITAISMSTELLQKSTVHPTPIQQKLFANIKNAADRMNYLVTNILNINRIERGMVSDDWRTVNLKSIIWDIVNRHQIFAIRKSIIIYQIADENVNWNILTEPNYLTQAIDNFLSNAIKFSHKNKSITLELHRHGEEMDVIITDEGQGIKEEDMPKLFGRFQKLSARPTANEISTGLGLSVAKEFVDVLRGHIAVKSTWGAGTTFKITLPIEPQGIVL